MKNSRINQLLLVKFPILFPIIYGSILYSFPQFETALIIFTILVLAETHFGATWPFFLSKMNLEFIKEKKINLIIVPILIVGLSIYGFFAYKNIFLLVFFIANIFHVTRQSSGVCKLYSKNSNEYSFQEKQIYFFNFIMFVVAYLRFYLPIIKSDHLFFLNILVLLYLFLISIYYIIKFNYSENYLTFITGMLIFFPACFVSNPVHVIIMGVTMHYTQYLYLTKHVNDFRNKSKNSILFSNKNYFITIISYSILMTILSIIGKSFDDEIFKNLILIPIIGQMLHFYLDSQLWRFSLKINRENTLKYLKEII